MRARVTIRQPLLQYLFCAIITILLLKGLHIAKFIRNFATILVTKQQNSYK